MAAQLRESNSKWRWGQSKYSCENYWKKKKSQFR